MRQDLYAELFEVENSHWWHAHKRAVAHDLIRRWTRPGRVLDVGAGTGRMLAELRKLGWRAAGVDGETEAAAFCRRRGVAVALAELGAGQLPFARGRFDLVLALDVLEHLPDDGAALKEMARVTRPGGIVLVSVPAYRRLFSYWDEMLGHCRRYTAGEMRALLSEAGYRVLRCGYYFSYILAPAVVVRLLKARAGRGRPAEPMVSDFQVRPLDLLISPVLRGLSAVERVVLRRSCLPFGLSLLGLAKKETDRPQASGPIDAN
jgi:SAM-dependent methyltransferase